jgi:membrane associated rhomboid family serine protease
LDLSLSSSGIKPNETISTNMDVGAEIKRIFRSGTSLTKLIIINLAVFLVIKIVGVVLFLFQQTELNNELLNFLGLPAALDILIKRPWTIITYMFLHYELFHILFNMLWLYWFGKIFLEYLDQKKLLSVYILGGIAGGAFYILCYNLFPVFESSVPQSIALGASAAVLAIVVTISVYAPDYTIHLLFLGPVKIKYIALVTIFIDLLSIQSGNAGGHLAHLGGALFGLLYGYQIRKGKDISIGFNRLMDKIFSMFKPRTKLHVKYKRPDKPENDFEYNIRKADEQKEIDRILDKISKTGYGALTKEEKELLFRSSKK